MGRDGRNASRDGAEPRWLVVYGSLMRGLAPRAVAFAADRSQHDAGTETGTEAEAPDLLDRLGAGAGLRCAGPCRVPGRLFDLGAYPALRPAVEPQDVVCGELHAILDPAVLEPLDAFEGYDANDRLGSEYLREPVVLLEPPGRIAWIYVFHGDPPPSARRVPSGDWRAHLAKRDDPAHVRVQEA